MFGLPDIAIGAIIAATITGLISLLGLIISKEQKISDFRQAWIDNLRTELSLVITHAMAIHGASVAEPNGMSEIWQETREHFVELIKQ